MNKQLDSQHLVLPQSDQDEKLFKLLHPDGCQYEWAYIDEIMPLAQIAIDTWPSLACGVGTGFVKASCGKRLTAIPEPMRMTAPVWMLGLQDYDVVSLYRVGRQRSTGAQKVREHRRRRMR